MFALDPEKAPTKPSNSQLPYEERGPATQFDSVGQSMTRDR